MDEIGELKSWNSSPSLVSVASTLEALYSEVQHIAFADKAEVQRAVRVADSLAGGMKELRNSPAPPAQWSLILNSALLKLAEESAESCPKLSRKIVTVFLESEKLNGQAAATSLVTMEMTSVYYGRVSLWSCLIELSNSCKKIMSDQIFDVLTVLEQHFDALHAECHGESLTQPQQRRLHILTKFSLQLFQSSVSCGQDHFSSPCLRKIVESLLNHLKSVLLNLGSGKDCCLLAGTSISFILKCLASSDEQEINMFLQIFYNTDSTINLDSLLFAESVIDSSLDPDFSHISLLGGLLSRVDAHLLCSSLASSSLASSSVASSSLYLWLFLRIRSLLHLSQHHFHLFQFLSQWFAKMSRLLPKIHQLTSTAVLDEDLWSLSLDIVWGYLDSPVEGVSECIAACFQNLLTISSSETEEFNVNNRTRGLLSRVMEMSWHLKGKHIMLNCLLSHCCLNEVFCYDPCMMEGMRSCLSTNYLAAPASDLYAGMLKILSEMENGLEVWKEHCLPCIATALNSSDSVMRHHVSQFWLPLTLRHTPSALSLLLKELESTPEAVMSVLRVARAQQLLTELPVDLLTVALSHSDVHMRKEAFTLICNSPKKSEPLSTVEVELLRCHLPFNLSVDSAPFRQQLQNDIHSVLVRSRDSAVTAIRSPKKKSPPTDNLAFIDWLWALCLDNLHPAANFQRTKTCLSLMNIILNAIVFDESRRGRKAGCPAAAKDLVGYGQSKGYLLFFSPDASIALLTCLLHGADEVREQAGSILHEFFPWPLPGGSTSELMLKALVLCNSCHARECQSGAALCNLIFSKLVVTNKKQIQFEMEASKWRIAVTDATEDSTLTFLECLTAQIERGVSEGQRNVLSAAKSIPVHGFLTAMQQCLKSLRQFKSLSVIHRIIVSAKNQVELALTVFGKNTEHPEMAPSFEEMSKSVEKVIHQCHAADPLEGTASADGTAPADGTALSVEYQLINTWCWNNIREVSLLLGILVSCQRVLSVDEVRDLGAVFIHILTCCRHRGAIEGCSQGFMTFCSHLLTSADPLLCAIPSDLLNQVLSQVISVSEGSVTRRSAGLPLIVQSILTSESHTRQTALLQRSVRSLMTTVSHPIPTSLDQRVDLAPVHAMHILKSIIQEASVAHAVLPYVGQAAEQALEGLSSPHWAIRNAATQLFGALMTRMLGQKKTTECSTVQEFFTMQPSLWSALLRLLQEKRPSGGMLHPSLFPALAILARLSPGIASPQIQEQLISVRSAVIPLAHSPMMAVRHLAAEALVSLVPPSDVPEFVLQLLSELPSYETNVNALHGTLCQIRQLLKSLKAQQRLASREAVRIVECLLLQQEHMLHSTSVCALVRCVYVQIIDELYEYEEARLSAALSPVVEEVLDKEICTIGSDQLRLSVLRLWLRSAAHPQLMSRLQRCLTSSRKEPRDAALKCIQESRGVPHEVFSMLLSTWLNDSAHSAGLLETLAGIQTSVQCDSEEAVASFSALMHHLSADDFWGPQILRVSAHFIPRIIPDDRHSDLLISWCRRAAALSNPLNNDISRSHVSAALGVAGQSLNEWARTQVEAMQCILTAIVNLLHDENANIRFSMRGTLLKCLPVHQNTDGLLEMFIARLLPSLCCDARGLDFLSGLIYTDDDCSSLSQMRWQQVFASEGANPYFEQWTVGAAILGAMKAQRESLPHVNNSTVEWVAVKIDEISTKLSAYLRIITEYEEGFVLNASYDRPLFTSLLNLLQLFNFVFLISPDCSELQEVRVLVDSLRKISSIHPCLRKAFNEMTIKINQ